MKSFDDERIEHHGDPEDGQADIAQVVAAGSKGLSKSADVAMSLFKDYDFNVQVDPQEEKKVVRRIDRFIIPMIMVNYIFFYIDKTTLSYAAIYGIRQDLHLTGSQYSWLSSIFYFGFLFWAFPTNFLMQRFPLGKYLGCNIIMWGVFLMLQASAGSFRTLAVLRFLSGAAEACSDPAFLLITQMWYTRRQQPFRIGIWYLGNGFGIAVGGLIGYGIGHIKSSIPAWKFEFIIIGALCIIWGIVITIFMPDSPVTAKFLSDHEKRITVIRLKDNQTGVENKHLKAYQVWEAFRDPKLYLFYILGTVCNLPNGGISNFGTLIVQGIFDSKLLAAAMQAPYGAFIALSLLACVYLNDRFPNNNRCKFVLLFLSPNIAGAFGLRFLAQSNHAGRYICYLLTGPYNAAFTLILSLQIANTAGHTKKVVTNAVLFLGYCTGNIAGPFFYLADQSPTYELGIWSMIVSHLLEVVTVLLFWFLLARENKRRDRIQGHEGLTAEEILEKQAAEGYSRTAFEDLTDRENLNFRYIY
ncbi:MFS transporter [Myriangium duriaei CBS 260.36]|uniref:MFS transporter n=1 Tax=Myriangium duriaei CBS 260.36 TaxID=1168546 RepID=A0A9P4J038_9PEZI|nr:MFS transporter [Myriangium duriaei CBS 260.36]